VDIGSANDGGGKIGFEYQDVMTWTISAKSKETKSIRPGSILA
jgi:hypothetical protein